MNTEITYFYRDEGGERCRTVVVEGMLTQDQIELILESCQAGGFLPCQVGLAPLVEFIASSSDGGKSGDVRRDSFDTFLMLDFHTDDVWHKLERESFCKTEETPTEATSAARLLEAFRQSAGNWDEKAEWRSVMDLAV